jgi:hypothetical protein
MGTTTFKPVNWNPNEIVSEEKMDQIANNVQWVKENKPDALYTLPQGTKRYSGVKVCGGRAIIPPNAKSDTANVRVRFSNFFTSRCQPLITTGVVSNHIRTFCIVNGINGLIPDDTGFEIQVMKFSQKQENINKTFYVNWIALGY